MTNNDQLPPIDPTSDPVLMLQAFNSSTSVKPNTPQLLRDAINNSGAGVLMAVHSRQLDQEAKRVANLKKGREVRNGRLS
jgi:ABC-type ATPase involved in cell division